MARPKSDDNWADLARSSRAALALLGYRLDSECLPGEPDRCGGSFAAHAAAFLVSIRAVANHHLDHVNGVRGSTFESSIEREVKRTLEH